MATTIDHPTNRVLPGPPPMLQARALLLPLLVVLVGGLPGPLSAAETAAESKQYTNYRPYIAGEKNATAWFGERAAIVLEEETPTERNPATMGKIVRAFDAIFDAYDDVTGRRPKLTAPLEGRIRIEVSKKVGGGLAHHGRLGIAVGPGFFRKLYERVDRGVNTYDQVFFYEIARNYWMPDMNPTIDYHTSTGESDYGWWTVGFNNALSVFMPSEIDEIEDMNYFGRDGEDFADGMHDLLAHYLENKEYDWENTWSVTLLPWREQKTSLNSLMSGLLIHLHREHGGNEFIRRLYQEIPKLEPLSSRSDWQGARDNFYLASSRAARSDLGRFYTRELRWKLSGAARRKIRIEAKSW